MMHCDPVLQKYQLEADKIRLRGIFEPFKLSLAVYNAMMSDAIQVRVSMMVPHRETGVMGPLAGEMMLNMRSLEREGIRHFHRMVHEYVRSLVAHELDECYRVDGELMFDPHKAGSMK